MLVRGGSIDVAASESNGSRSPATTSPSHLGNMSNRQSMSCVSYQSSSSNLQDYPAALREAFATASATSFSGAMPSASFLNTAFSVYESRTGKKIDVEDVLNDTSNELLKEVAAVVLQSFARQIGAKNLTAELKRQRQADFNRVCEEDLKVMRAILVQNQQRKRKAEQRVEAARRARKAAFDKDVEESLQHDRATVIQSTFRRHLAVQQANELNLLRSQSEKDMAVAIATKPLARQRIESLKARRDSAAAQQIPDGVADARIDVSSPSDGAEKQEEKSGGFFGGVAADEREAEILSNAMGKVALGFKRRKELKGITAAAESAAPPAPINGDLQRRTATTPGGGSRPPKPPNQQQGMASRAGPPAATASDSASSCWAPRTFSREGTRPTTTVFCFRPRLSGAGLAALLSEAMEESVEIFCRLRDEAIMAAAGLLSRSTSANFGGASAASSGKQADQQAEAPPILTLEMLRKQKHAPLPKKQVAAQLDPISIYFGLRALHAAAVAIKLQRPGTLPLLFPILWSVPPPRVGELLRARSVVAAPDPRPSHDLSVRRRLHLLDKSGIDYLVSDTKAELGEMAERSTVRGKNLTDLHMVRNDHGSGVVARPISTMLPQSASDRAHEHFVESALLGREPTIPLTTDDNGRRGSAAARAQSLPCLVEHRHPAGLHAEMRKQRDKALAALQHPHAGLVVTGEKPGNSTLGATSATSDNRTLDRTKKKPTKPSKHVRLALPFAVRPSTLRLMQSGPSFVDPPGDDELQQRELFALKNQYLKNILGHYIAPDGSIRRAIG